jgi:hypothetical protein
VRAASPAKNASEKHQIKTPSAMMAPEIYYRLARGFQQRQAFLIAGKTSDIFDHDNRIIFDAITSTMPNIVSVDGKSQRQQRGGV